MTTLAASAVLEAWESVTKERSVSTRDEKPLSEVEAWRADDLRAAKYITIIMNAIFVAALVLYGTIAVAVALGGQP